MAQPLGFDDEARVELLCYPLIGELVAMARLAPTLAADALTAFDLTSDTSLARLFTDGWRLDYRLPLVCEIREFCAVRLRRA